MNPINIKYKLLDGYELSPKNWELIGIQADLTVDWAQMELTDDTLVFEGKDRTKLFNILENVGYEASIPMNVVIPSDSPTVSDIEIEYVLTFQEESDLDITFGASIRYGIGRFIDRANSSTWDVINDKVPFTDAVKFPYRVVDPNPIPQLIMLYSQGAMSTIALYDSITGLASAIAAALGGISGIAESVAQIALEATRAVLVGITLAITGKQIFRTYYPKQKYLWEVKILELMEKGCQSLGYTLQSTLLQSYANAGLIPVPLREENQTILNDLFDNVNIFNNKFPSSLDSVPTFGLFFQAIKEMLSAKVLIIGNVLQFESDAFFQNNPQPQIKTMFNDQEALINRRGYNLSESWYHKYIGYQKDTSDVYTLDQIKGLRAEYQTVYTGTASDDLVTFQENEPPRIDIPFSMAKRKSQLSYLDEQAILFGAAIDGIVNFFGGNSDLVGSVTGSIGQMIISDPYFVKTKFVWAIGGKQPSNYLDYISAKAIYQNNHTYLQVKENFQEIQEMKVPFSVSNFRSIISSYYIKDENNVSLKVARYSYVPYVSEIELTFSIYRPEKSKTTTIELHG